MPSFENIPSNTNNTTMNANGSMQTKFQQQKRKHTDTTTNSSYHKKSKSSVLVSPNVGNQKHKIGYTLTVLKVMTML